MNKKELIEILKKRSKETFQENNNIKPDNEANHKEYLSKAKFRKEDAPNKTLKYIVLIFILLGVIAYLVYKPLSLSINKISSIDENYILKKDIKFEDLSTSLKNRYILKDKMDKNIEKTKEQEQEKQQEKIISLEKEIVLLNEKFELANIEKNEIRVEAQLTRSKRYNATGCYSQKEGSYNIYGDCKEKIDKFLKENKKATSYEIIPVTDVNDKSFLKELIKDSKDIDSKTVKDYLVEGLARKRVLEASWYVKKQLGKKTIITYVNYIADTSDKRGFTIRAYK